MILICHIALGLKSRKLAVTCIWVLVVTHRDSWNPNFKDTYSFLSAMVHSKWPTSFRFHIHHLPVPTGFPLILVTRCARPPISKFTFPAQFFLPHVTITALPFPHVRTQCCRLTATTPRDRAGMEVWAIKAERDVDTTNRRIQCVRWQRCRGRKRRVETIEGRLRWDGVLEPLLRGGVHDDQLDGDLGLTRKTIE